MMERFQLTMKNNNHRLNNNINSRAIMVIIKPMITTYFVFFLHHQFLFVYEFILVSFILFQDVLTLCPYVTQLQREGQTALGE